MKKFQAVAKQKLATLQDRSGSFESGSPVSDNATDQVKAQALFLAMQGNQLRDVYKKLESQIKAGSTYIESGRNVSDTLRDFSTRLVPDTPLASCVRNVAELQRDLEDAKSDLQNACLKLLYEPIRDSVKGEIKESLEAEKRYDKSKAAHESAVIKLRTINEKSKANVAKVVEAEQERDATKGHLEQTEKDSFKTLYEMNFKVEVETMERLVAYTEAYYDYFERSALRVRQLFKEVDSYRDYIEQRFVEYERETGKPLPHILEPRKKRPNTFADDDADIVVKKEGKAIDRKQRTLDDIVIAERSYLNTLKNIKQNFMIPLQKLQKDPKLALKITDEDISAVFSNLEELLLLHNVILAELVSAQEMYPTKLVGAFILQKLPQMQTAYTYYVNNFRTSINALQELKKSKAVSSFLKTCERTTTTSLSALLALPLKRINQYEFWFEKLFQDTNTTDPDFPNLEDAIERISQLATEVVKGNEKGAELAQIMAVQKKIQGYEEDLVDPDRLFIKEGYLTILNQKNAESPKKLHNYMCFLFNDMLIYSSKSSVASRVQQARNTMEILQDSFVYVGLYFTHKFSIQDLPDTEDTKYAFHIVVKDKEPVLVVCSSNGEKLDWIQALNRAIGEADKRKVYGVPLQELLKHPSEQGRAVPSIVEKIVEYLEAHALESEGLFRLSGGALLIEKMKDLIDRGKSVELEGKDFHAIAGLLKLWLREFPDPLLTFALYDQWLNAGKIEDRSQMIDVVRSLVQRLPLQNKYLLQYLMSFLVKVANKGSVNKMHAMNLSIVFGPNVLHQRNADAYDTTNMAIIYSVVQLFIEQYDLVFEGIDEERRNYEEKSMKEVEEKREKEALEQEKAKQGQKEEKREAKLKLEKEKEKKELEEKMKKEKDDEERKKEEKRVREELERQMREEIEVEKEKERERIKQQLLNEEKLKLSEQQKIEQQKLKEKLENEEAEYRKKRELEEEKYLKRRQEEEERQQRILDSKHRELEQLAKKQEEEDRIRARDAQRKREEQEESIKNEPQLPPPVQSPLCDECQLPIQGQGLQALNKSWHSHCFVCKECKKPISGSFMHANGKPYCAEDYQKLFAKYCGGCGNVIVGPLVRAMGKEWHPQNCFVCEQCRGTLSTGFFEKGGKPYCRNCVQ